MLHPKRKGTVPASGEEHDRVSADGIIPAAGFRVPTIEKKEVATYDYNKLR